MTMATWGGSTAGNLESIEEDDRADDRQPCGHHDDDGMAIVTLALQFPQH